MRRAAFLTTLAVAGFLAAFLVTRMTRPASRLDGRRGRGRPSARRPVGRDRPPGVKPPGMAWVPGGEFTMGSDDPEAAPAERPAHRVRVDGFWMDVTEVTNAQFRKFVEATGYATTAERPVDWEQLRKELPPGTPRPPDDRLAPGSLVFSPPDHPVSLDDQAAWWRWVAGASWRHPEGPGSSIEGKDDHPVVHVSWDDALAYATMGRQAAPDRGRVGVRGPGRPRRPQVCLGRRVPARRQAPGEHLAGPLPGHEHAGRRLPPDGPGQVVPAQRVRPARHDRQRLGVVRRLVQARCLSLGPGRRGRREPDRPRGQLRPRRALPAQASDARRLVPVQPELLLELPARRPPRDRLRLRHVAPRVPVRHLPRQGS